MTEPAPPPTEAAPREPTRRDAVAALRRAIEHTDPGTRAALRRLDPASPPPAFYRVALGPLDEHRVGLASARVESKWAVVASAFATAHGFLGNVAFGEALAKAGVAEMRVLRLLEGDEAQLPDIVRNLVHQLVQKGQAFNPQDLANLVLADEGDREPRRAIARAYYHHAET